MSQSIVIANSPGKGKGIFAVQEITKGECLIREKPIMRGSGQDGQLLAKLAAQLQALNRAAARVSRAPLASSPPVSFAKQVLCQRFRCNQQVRHSFRRRNLPERSSVQSYMYPDGILGLELSRRALDSTCYYRCPKRRRDLRELCSIRFTAQGAHGHYGKCIRLHM